MCGVEPDFKEGGHFVNAIEFDYLLEMPSKFAGANFRCLNKSYGGVSAEASSFNVYHSTFCSTKSIWMPISLHAQRNRRKKCAKGSALWIPLRRLRFHAETGNIAIEAETPRYPLWTAALWVGSSPSGLTKLHSMQN